MGGSSTCVAWRQAWGPDAERSLSVCLARSGLELLELPSQQWDSRASTIGGVRDYKCLRLGPGVPGWSVVLLELGAEYYEDLARDLSLAAPVPALTFTEWDQIAWGYSLWANGKRVESFWNDPEAVGEDSRARAGEPSLLAFTCGVSEASIRPYLRQRVQGAAIEGRAHPDDEFELDDPWVRVDVMRRLGIGYPDLKSPAGRYVTLARRSA